MWTLLPITKGKTHHSPYPRVPQAWTVIYTGYRRKQLRNRSCTVSGTRWSRTSNSLRKPHSQQGWTKVTRRELLAIVTFLKQFRHYLYGHEVLVRTDHGALRWLMNFKDPEGQLARWLEIISRFRLTLQHRAGRIHMNADGLSRRPCTQCGQPNDVCKEKQKIDRQTGKMMLFCRVCNAAYTIKSQLHAHMEAAHRIPLTLTCEHCPYETSFSSDCKRHYSRGIERRRKSRGERRKRDELREKMRPGKTKTPPPPPLKRK